MTDTAYGTRWGRASVAMVIGIGLLATLLTAMRTELISAFDSTITINNGNATFASSRIYAADAGFGTAVVGRQDGGTQPVLRAGFASATMNGFCLTKTESVPLVGDVTFHLQSGDGNASTSEISARSAAFDITYLRAASSPGIDLKGSTQIGLATTDLTTTPGTAPFDANPFEVPKTFDPRWYSSSRNGGHNNGQGYTAIDATTADLNMVYGDIWQAQIEGDIALPDLRIRVVPGKVSCRELAERGEFPR